MPAGRVDTSEGKGRGRRPLQGRREEVQRVRSVGRIQGSRGPQGAGSG